MKSKDIGTTPFFYIMGFFLLIGLLSILYYELENDFESIETKLDYNFEIVRSRLDDLQNSLDKLNEENKTKNQENPIERCFIAANFTDRNVSYLKCYAMFKEMERNGMQFLCNGASLEVTYNSSDGIYVDDDVYDVLRRINEECVGAK